jgi:diaminopimelate decarboxylase
MMKERDGTSQNRDEMPLPPCARLWPDTARVDGAGRLWLGGMMAARLAGEFGTPLYVYDEVTIRARCRAFRDAFAERWPASAVAYAGKAYLSPALCHILLDEGMELDAVSAGEVGLAMASGYPAERIHLHGNYKPEAELAAALDTGVGRVVVDSLEELEQVEALARERARRVAIWLRLNPDVATETHAAVQTGHAGSKFGLDSPAVDAAARRAMAAPWVELVGLHAHAGSQLLDVRPAERVVAFLCEAAARLRAAHGIAIREISPGGGLGVAYTPGEAPSTVAEYAEAVTGALRAGVARHGLEPPRLVVEPGRAIVAQAGVALYTIGPRKLAPNGTTLVAVDGGMGDNPRPALYGARYHAALAERMTVPAVERARIVGRYCESGDVLVEESMLPLARAGETLAIPVSGAYQLAMASAYNLAPRPAVVFVADGRARLVRRRETLDDLLRADVMDRTD